MRWTHLHTATVILLGLAFVGVTVVKHGPTLTSATPSDTTRVAASRTQAKTFWRSYRQATQHRTGGRLDSAAVTYRSALERRPTHHDALYYLGHVLYAQGNLRAARDAWQRLLEANSNSARAYTQIGEVHFCVPGHPLFDLDRAQRAYRRALELHNEETRPLVRMGTIALLTEESRPQKYLEAVRGSNRNNPAAAFLVGYLAWKDGASARATVLLRKAQNRSEAQKASSTRSCPLAERLTAPLRETDRRSSPSDSSAYARLDRLLMQIRSEHPLADS